MINLVRNLVLGACMTMVAVAPASSQTFGDASAGRAIAATFCAQCHRISALDRDTDRMPPDFAAVANMPSFTELSMRVFLQTPHGQMPRYQFSQNELDDIIAYLASLKRR